MHDASSCGVHSAGNLLNPSGHACRLCQEPCRLLQVLLSRNQQLLLRSGCLQAVLACHRRATSQRHHIESCMLHALGGCPAGASLCCHTSSVAIMLHAAQALMAGDAALGPDLGQPEPAEVCRLAGPASGVAGCPRPSPVGVQCSSLCWTCGR